MNDLPRYRLEDAEREWLEESRAWIKGHFSEEADDNYADPDAKLAVVRANIAQGWVGPEDTWKLQALGIAMGDALADELLLDWVTIEDEYGRVPALNWPGTSIVLYPVTMISQRIERGEEVDIDVMFEETRTRLQEIAFSGDVQ
ncbi:DUF3806 domain-containing protein [Croceicoccus naphthovorans]|uniref:Uncharacterized protein n=1 Tax=Croceicoccus naphthovorans TaxID=1348774 RepID=A0A0G3XJ74_9SPHN|nr:DUF3806 domain-containing protein [Croceicoccus naphthovorans]AKM10438.1 hypothetical protein AB433_11465 [Croceicoccus naphthovorans]MBB3990150.1 hypothetical protein [Croceicoccus naphthovorans]